MQKGIKKRSSYPLPLDPISDKSNVRFTLFEISFSHKISQNRTLYDCRKGSAIGAKPTSGFFALFCLRGTIILKACPEAICFSELRINFKGLIKIIHILYVYVGILGSIRLPRNEYFVGRAFENVKFTILMTSIDDSDYY